MNLGLNKAFVIAILAAPASAGPPVLDLPIDCELGIDCYIEDYVDADPSSGQSDFSCGLKSRDGHRGTDFVLDTFDRMAMGVDVLAAAKGTVAAVRDGVPDQAVTDENRHLIEGRECGNAVRVDHGDGWQTLYCHLAKGSVRVQSGDDVNPGDPLGKIGLSGLTNVPHLHLGVLKNGTTIDPFQPEPRQDCGGEQQNGLWRNLMPYDPAGLFTVGFSTQIPDFSTVKSGDARRRSGAPDSPIVLYAQTFQTMAGDVLHFVASGPEGDIFETTVTLDEAQAQLFRAFGRKSPDTGWPKGDYRGYVTLKREGKILAVRHADFTVER